MACQVKLSSQVIKMICMSKKEKRAMASIFGKRLVELRQEHQLTQNELAEKVGLSRPMVSYFESRAKNPTLETVQKIADFFDVPPESLISENDKDTKKTTIVNLNNYLSKKQKRMIATKPDVIWQFAQHLKQDYKSKGQDIEVYVTAKTSVNGRPFKTLINPKVDMANARWEVFKHNNWILPSQLDK